MSVDDNDLEEFGLAGDVQVPAPSPSATPPPVLRPHPRNNFPTPPAPSPPSSTPATPEWEELLGEEILGKTGKPQSAADILNALGQRAAMRQPLVRRQPTKSRDAQIGFGQVEIQPGTEETLTVQVQQIFRGEKLVVYESVPHSTEITGLFVGNTNQFPIGGPPIASVHFAGNSLGSGVKYTTAHPGISITIRVRNTSNQPVKWAAAMFGRTVD